MHNKEYSQLSAFAPIQVTFWTQLLLIFNNFHVHNRKHKNWHRISFPKMDNWTTNIKSSQIIFNMYGGMCIYFI